MPSSAAVAAAKVESFESWRERFDLNCANCKVFGWKQPDPRNESLRKCTGCRQIYYCGRHSSYKSIKWYGRCADINLGQWCSPHSAPNVHYWLRPWLKNTCGNRNADSSSGVFAAQWQTKLKNEIKERNKGLEIPHTILQPSKIPAGMAI